MLFQQQQQRARQSDQQQRASTGTGPNNSSSMTMSSSARDSGASSMRRFAGHKISKVRFMSDQVGFSGQLVTGSWNRVAPDEGMLTLWQMGGGGAKDTLERSLDWLPVGPGVDVNEIFVINRHQFVASMSSGEVKIVNLVANTGGGQSTERDDTKMSELASFPRVHGKHAASTALCALENDIYSGSETGQIVRIQPDSSQPANAVRPFVEELMGVTGLCASGQFQLVSAHSTGQLHLWDVRKRPTGAEFGIEPLNSRPMTTLNNAITALAVHPTQQNVIGFGTRDGVVSFVDIRQTSQPLPIPLKIAQEPIYELKFHPVFANNCFSLTQSSIIHWDGSVLAHQPTNFNRAGNGPNGNGNHRRHDPSAGMFAAMQMEDGNGGEHRNVWLSARASTNMNLRALVEEEPKMLSSFDLVQGALVAGSHTAQLLLLNGVNFTN